MTSVNAGRGAVYADFSPAYGSPAQSGLFPAVFRAQCKTPGIAEGFA